MRPLVTGLIQGALNIVNMKGWQEKRENFVLA
jgi:hypothetical protein